MKHDYNNEASQADRYAVLVNDKRAHKNTVLSHTHPAEEMGGRFKAVHTQTVIGEQSQINYPAAAPWSMTTLPPEEPTGYDINSQEAVGTIQEVAASFGSATFPAALSEDDASPAASPRSPHSEGRRSSSSPAASTKGGTSSDLLRRRASAAHSFKRRV
jgi:hypothetical protein